MTSATIVDDELLTREPKVTSTSTTSYGDTKELGKSIVLVTCAEPTILTAGRTAIVNSIRIDGAIDNLSVCPGNAIASIRMAGSHGDEAVKSYASEDIKAMKQSMAPIIELPLDVSSAPIPARL